MNSSMTSNSTEVAEIPTVAEGQTDTIDSSGFENKRWMYLFTVPFGWVLTLWVMAKKSFCWTLGIEPKVNTIWFDGLGLQCRAIKEGAASWKALDLIYNHEFGQGRSVRGAIDDFWIGMLNAQAVRNRLKLVKQELRSALLRSGNQEVRLLSLAAGSAQAVIEVMAELKSEGVLVQAMLLDIDQTALDYSEMLAMEHGVRDQIETVKASVVQVKRVASDFSPDVIEMLGLLDYIPQEKAIRLVSKIYQSLKPDGIFLTCNIRRNPEMHFLRWVIDWEMIYRTPKELIEVVTKAGFQDYRLVYEPLRMHGILVARKVLL